MVGIHVTSFSSISYCSILRLISNMLFEHTHPFYTRHSCFHSLASPHSFLLQATWHKRKIPEKGFSNGRNLMQRNSPNQSLTTLSLTYIRTTLDHPNTEHVWFSSPCCTCQINFSIVSTLVEDTSASTFDAQQITSQKKETPTGKIQKTISFHQ